MGRTESFLPGRVKAAWEVELAAAALAEEAAAEDEAESAAEEAAAEEEAESAAEDADVAVVEEEAPEDAEDVAEAEDDPVADAEPESVGVALVPTVDNPYKFQIVIRVRSLQPLSWQGTGVLTLTERAAAAVPDAAAEVAEVEVLLDPDAELETEPEPMDIEPLLLDICVVEDISALMVVEPLLLDICVMEDMSALMVDEEK